MNNSSEIIQRWAQGEELPDTQVQDAFEELVANGKPFVDLFLVAIANRRVQGIIKMFNQVNAIEERLFRDTRLDFADTEDLIRLLTVLSKNMADSIEFVRQFGTGKILPTAAKREEDTAYDEFDRLPPESKQRLMSVIKELQTRVGEEPAQEKDEEKIDE